MKLLGTYLLDDFKLKHADARAAIDSWRQHVKDAAWKTSHDVRQTFPKVSIIGEQQIVFNISGNKYRLWVQIAYKTGVVLINKIGTHKEYEKWKIN